MTDSQLDTHVLRFQQLSSEEASSIFVNLEIRDTTRTRGKFVVSALQGLRVVRSICRGGGFKVLHLDHHIGEERSLPYFACIPLRGSITCQQGNLCDRLNQGDIGLIDAGCEYAIDMGDDIDALWLQISRQDLEGQSFRPSAIRACHIDGSHGLGLLTSNFATSAASQSMAAENLDGAPIRSMLVGLLSGAIGELGPTDSHRLGSSTSRTLRRAYDYIEEHLDEDDLTPKRVAAAIGVNVRYLGSLFAADGGSIMRWVTHRRLMRCRLALGKRKWSPGIITEVALDHGFANVCSFNRAFKAKFGRPPKEYMS